MFTVNTTAMVKIRISGPNYPPIPDLTIAGKCVQEMLDQRYLLLQYSLVVGHKTILVSYTSGECWSLILGC